MNILYISQYFPPEVGATQIRAYEMAKNLVRQGHRVTVLTEFPNHPKGIIPSHYRGRWREYEILDGIHVVRTWVFARPDKTFAIRMGFYLSFMLNALLAGVFLRGSYDIVYATSPPFFVGVTGLLLSRVKGAKFVFEIRDLWPKSAVQLGELSNPRFIRWAEALETFYYRRAKRIIAVTEGIQKELINRGYEKRVDLVRNGSNTELFFNTGGRLRERLGWQQKFIVMYAGIIGIAQGMEQLCELVERLKSHTDIHFVFIGEGPMKTQVETLKHLKELDNLTLFGEVPRERISEYLSAADCCLVPLKKNPLFLGALPSKMFDCMACERPVILSVDGEARKVLEVARAGVYVRPEDTEEMAAAVLHLKGNPDLRRDMGRAGRTFVREHFSRRRSALLLEKIFREIVNN